MTSRCLHMAGNYKAVDQLLVGTYPRGAVGTTSRSVELGTSTSLEVTSDQYGLMLLEAGTRDIICNPSLTDPSQYPAVGSEPFLSMSETGHHQQQQEINQWPEPLLTKYYLLLKGIADSLDLEQVKSLCFISVEAEKAGICNRDDFSGMVLLNFFHKMMLISPNNLTYLTSKLHSIDRMDLCGLIDQYISQLLSTQPLPHGDPPADERPPPYNPEFVSVPLHGQPHPVCSVSSANTIQLVAPMLGSLSEQNSYSLPFQEQDNDVSHMEYSYRIHNTSNHSQVINRVGNGFEKQSGVVTYQTCEQLRIRQLEEQVACLQSRLQDREDLVIRQGDTIVHYEDTIMHHKATIVRHEDTIVRHEDTIVRHEVTIDHDRRVIKYKNELIESLISLPVCPVEKYEMNKFPHGIAVIINIFEFYSLDPSFDPPLLDRPGSCADEEHLHSTWEYLGYDVCIFRNLTALDLTQRLEQISKQSHENYDSFVCCILSHGYPNGIYGADSKQVEIGDIANLFKPTNCPTLAGKPKMFFIQACRGEKKDTGFVFEKDGKRKNLEEPFVHSLPNDADFLFGFATPPGSVSWRSQRYGTWYISHLCEVLTNYYLHRDMLSMLTIVNYRVSEAYTNRGCKQCPAPVTQLRKQVWLISRSTE